MWFLYVLKCSEGSLYTGISNNIEKRIKQHNSGKASKYTRARLPVVLIYTEEFDSKSKVLKREIAVKRLTRADKLKLVGKNNDQ